MLSDELVTFASGSLETLAIEHPNLSSVIVDELSTLELTGCLSHARASDAQHLPQIFLRERYLVSEDAIMRHQEPARTALFDRMRPIAGGGLSHLGQEGLRVAPDQIPPRGTSLDDSAKDVGSQANGVPGDLDEDLHDGAAIAHVGGEPDDAFVADRRDLDDPAFLQPRHHRRHTIAREVDVSNRLIQLIEGLPASKRRGLELRRNATVLRTRKRRQNVIRVPSLRSRFGHLSSGFERLLPFHREHILCRTSSPVCTAAYRQKRLRWLGSNLGAARHAR